MSSISPMTDVFQMQSAVAGKNFEITVGAPLPGTTSAPPRLFYVTDPMQFAAAAIDLARAMARDRDPIVPLIVVAVGTPIETHSEYVGYIMQARNGLLVPPEEGINDGIMGSLPDQPAPEAHRFLRFIAEELDPLLRSKYEVSAEPAGIYGHSYGGLFTAYALGEQLPTFDRYILSSTGMLNGRAMLKRFCNTEPGKLKGRVFLGLGEYEDASAKEYDGDLGIAWHRLCEALAPSRQPRIELRAEVQAGHGHGSVSYINLARGMRWLYGASTNRT